ncbi:MAG: SpoIIE family protein phosphatase [Bacteroidota bacterium]
MKINKNLSLLLYVLFGFYTAYAQGISDRTSDSLIKKAGVLYLTAPDQSYTYALKALELARNEGNELNIAKAYEMIGISLDYLGNLDSALIYFDKSIDVLKNQKNNLVLSSVYKSKANTLTLLNKNKDALAYYLKGLELVKNTNNKRQEASFLMGIGNVYSSMKFYDLSLKYYNESLTFFEEVKDSVFISYLFTNISEVYAALNNGDKELEYQLKSLSIKEKLKDEYGLVYSYTNMAQLMAKFNKKDSALYFADAAINLSKKINNLDFLSSSYMAMGSVYNEFHQYNEAIDYYNQALNIARKVKNPKMEYDLLKILSDAYITTGNYKDAAITLKQFIGVNDSVNSLETKKSFNELQTQYETDKKEKEIEILNERDKKRNYLIYSSFIVVALLVLLSFTLYNRFRLKRKTATELETRNNEIQKQKHLVDEKQKEILDSINYAKRIQYALLAHDELLNKNLPEHFILFKPKDIVSGDFYWATRHQNKFYLACCDSTGHGVPGAFMSLLNIGFLSEAIKEKEITQPNEILNYVRNRLIESISDDKQKDGMDAILLCIDKTTHTITYAAANNEPILIRNKTIIELQKDKMPVGKGENANSFTSYTLELQKGDSLYLYTDGFADQFGGPKGKKFKYKQLHDIFLSNIDKPCAEQKEVLDSVFENWRGNLEQVDDVCVIGIKF